MATLRNGRVFINDKPTRFTVNEDGSLNTGSALETLKRAGTVGMDAAMGGLAGAKAGPFGILGGAAIAGTRSFRQQDARNQLLAGQSSALEQLASPDAAFERGVTQPIMAEAGRLKEAASTSLGTSLGRRGLNDSALAAGLVNQRQGNIERGALETVAKERFRAQQSEAQRQFLAEQNASAADAQMLSGIFSAATQIGLELASDSDLMSEIQALAPDALKELFGHEVTTTEQFGQAFPIGLGF